jgi:hypothetical protein
MIIVDMELKSAVSSSRDRNLGRIEISNIGQDDRGSYADYRVRLYARNHGRCIREVEIIGWPKKAQPAWRLIQEAMRRLSMADDEA